MLVGAGEIDAAMLVVAADDGPRAQTLEHLALLDALGIAPGIAVVTKVDAVPVERTVAVVDEVRALLAGTSLAGAPVLAASALSGEGLDAVRVALVALTERVTSLPGPPRLAIDRVFSVKGRGVVVTGTLRGGPLSRNDRLRLVPGSREARIREIQSGGRTIERAEGGGRTALNLADVDADDLHRGTVLTGDDSVVATDRVLAAFSRPVGDRTRARLHAGTAAADAAVGRSGRDALTLPDGRAAGVVRLAVPIGLRPGDRFVLRRGPAIAPVGGVVLDTAPPRGISRRRQTPERVGALAGEAVESARLELHGAAGGRLAPDVAAIGAAAALAAVDPEASLVSARAATARALRGVVTVRRDEAAALATRLVDGLVFDGRLAREGERLRRPGVTAGRPDTALAAAMDRLEGVLGVPSPPSLADAARSVGCPPEGIRALERGGRIVVLAPDLAYASATYRDLTARALAMASRGPLTPAAFRDATGTSRKYVMAILEDLDRRAILRRTPAGHVPGPRAPAEAAR
jgi:selenocysteine-specific elongation factor